MQSDGLKHGVTMSSAGNIPRPQNEVDRLAAVQRYQLLDTPPESEFDFLAHVAAIICLDVFG